ncbi:tyrosine-type recombinase/integrase [Aurantimicrobium minutum]|uniref:tyrosine-type recombinase/integrase n=1 Tax=Aurantimicrobium minutum TaxID=708131 RepID=UPI002472F294|nr:tyrosine-type recombinase/integrase [Aurantimicrobium minutum]
MSETVRRKYKRNYELHILKELGDIPLVELTDTQLKKHFWETLVNKKNETTGKELLGSSARRNIYKTLNSALKVAVKKGLIPLNPLELVKSPPMVRPEENVPQVAHKAQTLLVRMKQDDHPDYARFLLMFLGLRRSERLGLSWSNIKDLNGKEPKMVINQQLARYEDGSGYYIKQRTKMGNPRTIPIPEPFLSALRQHKKKMDAWKKASSWNPKPDFADLVFLQEDGSLITQNRDNLDWHAVLDHYRFNYWRGHLNRHITATLLADQQPPVSIGVVQTLLGNGEAMAYYYARITNKAMKVPMANYGETAFASLLNPESTEKNP